MPLQSALQQYREEVSSRAFPSARYSPYSIPTIELDSLIEALKRRGDHAAAAAVVEAAEEMQQQQQQQQQQRQLQQQQQGHSPMASHQPQAGQSAGVNGKAQQMVHAAQ
jgi:hypothetical protein